MTGNELKLLKTLRAELRGSGLFCFERDGVFFLYREGQAGDRNSKVLKSSDLNEFVRRTRAVMVKS